MEKISVDTEIIEQLQSIKSVELNIQGSFAPEYLSFEFIKKVLEEISNLNSVWQESVGSMLMYGRTVEQIGNTTPPEITPLRRTTVNSTNGAGNN